MVLQQRGTHLYRLIPCTKILKLFELHKDFEENGTNNNRRAEAVASADGIRERHERLGLRAVRERGRPTLGNRWDTELYEEGLPPSQGPDLLGGQESAVRTEPNGRLICKNRYLLFGL